MMISIREARRSDVNALCSILNEIITIGGTTGFESRFSAAEFISRFLSEPNCICCFLAEDNELILGFQSLSIYPGLPDRWADIATFARVNSNNKGVGTSLFEATLIHLQHKNVDMINATIRSDNTAGLNYYSKMGFEQYSVAEKVPLLDGTPVDRISKKYAVRKTV